MLADLRRRLRRQARRLDRLAAALPGGPEERLACYRSDPARLMVDAGYHPDPWQRDLLRSPAPRVLMLTCRQAGKSTTAGFLALREALAAPGNTVLVVCPSQRQSAELVRRVTTGRTVAKKHLVGAVQAPLCSGRLRFAEGLELTPVLAKELSDFRVRVTDDRNETFASWRERDHDDLVLALALALFVGSFQPVRFYC